MVPVRDDARLLARVAFGITSPRVTAMKLSKNPVFGSMATSDFMVSFVLYRGQIWELRRRLYFSINPISNYQSSVFYLLQSVRQS